MDALQSAPVKDALQSAPVDAPLSAPAPQVPFDVQALDGPAERVIIMRDGTPLLIRCDLLAMKTIERTTGRSLQAYLGSPTLEVTALVELIWALSASYRLRQKDRRDIDELASDLPDPTAEMRASLYRDTIGVIFQVLGRKTESKTENDLGNPPAPAQTGASTGAGTATSG